MTDFPPELRPALPRQASSFDSLAAAIVSSASDAILALDRDGLVTVWNRGCEQLFGWSAPEVLGRSVLMLLPADRQHELVRVLSALGGADEEAALETERLHRSGTSLPISCRLTPLRDAAGAVVGVCAVMRDNSREVELRRQLEQARQLAEARFEQSVVAQATLSPDGVVLEANPALLRLLGHRAADVLGRHVSSFLDGCDAEGAPPALRLVADGSLTELRRPQRLRHADGHVIETRISVFPLRDVDRDVVRLEVVVEDVSEAAAAYRELELREARWRSLASHSADVALFCDADAQVQFASDSVSTVFGYDAAALTDADGWSFVHPDDVASVRALWDATVRGPVGTSVTFEVRLRRADGAWRWVEDTVTNHLADPAVQAMVVNLVDITDRKCAEEVLDELVGMDSLTGLASRAPLMASLDAAFAAGRAGTTAVAVVDLTRLKLVNDTYGHRAGDEVLIEMARRLTRAVDGDGVVARIGGDRFAVLLTDVDDVSDMFETCAALLRAVEEPLHHGDHRLLLTATVGAAVGPAVDSGALLASAESALATAKDGLAGPLHVVRAESASAALCRARLIEDLRRGLDAGELVVHFQPVVSLGDGRTVAAEALVRWAHPDKGLLSPGAFIDAAEDSGLILRVGEVVLEQACRAAARWGGTGSRSAFHVAVNLSAKQLTRGGVVDVVRRALADSGASPQSLMLEVTESAVMADVKTAVETLQELRELGVAIAVDDFGTGYSSLTYLKQFPVTTLKIDRSFVSGLGKNHDDAAIVTSVINLARSMGLDCIAEGVETQEQRLVLQALGCSLGQGFLWSPALDAATFATWLGDGHHEAAPPAALAPQRARQQRVDQDVLDRIRDLLSAGASLTTVAAALNADALLTPQGRRWTTRSVAEVVSSLGAR